MSVVSCFNSFMCYDVSIIKLMNIDDVIGCTRFKNLKKNKKILQMRQHKIYTDFTYKVTIRP